MQQMSASAQNLSTLAEGLRTALGRFKVTAQAAREDVPEGSAARELVGAGETKAWGR